MSSSTVISKLIQSLQPMTHVHPTFIVSLDGINLLFKLLLLLFIAFLSIYRVRTVFRICEKMHAVST